MLSSPGAVHSNSYNWMLGAITTVMSEHKRLKAPSAAKISFGTWMWFTESS
jgi:hypothetical protein